MPRETDIYVKTFKKKVRRDPVHSVSLLFVLYINIVLLQVSINKASFRRIFILTHLVHRVHHTVLDVNNVAWYISMQYS